MKSHLRYSNLLNVAAFGVALIGSAPAFAQSAPEDLPADTAPAADAAAEVIVVTGTRTSGLAVADSPAPIQVLSADILDTVGQGNLVQGLAQNIPSFNAQAFGGDASNLTLSAKLRGLSPNHALVLVNGKRRHGSANLSVSAGPYQGGAAADLNFIPLASVDHIEVLLEGAAAQYGSDAIAGVINIIQKTKDSGGEIEVNGGEYFDGGGTTGGLTANFGFAPVEQSFLNITFESKYHDFSFRGDVDPRVQNTPYNGAAAARLSNYPQLATAPGYPYLNRIAGDAEYRLYTGAYNFGYDAADNLQFYSSGTFGSKFAQAIENYRVPNLVVGRDGSIPFPLGFSPRIQIDETDYSLTAGLKSDLAGWAVDLGTTYGSDTHNVNVISSFNRSLYIDTSTTTTPGFSPTDFHVGDFIDSQWTTNLDVSREFNIGLANPLNVAAGLEYREDTYEIRPGDAASRYKEGSQSYPGFSLTDAGHHARDSRAVYVDLALKPVDALQIDAAVRYEDFSDFGDTTVAKLTGRYDFNDAFALRATASTGFRAPTLAEQFYSATSVSPTSAFVQLPPNAAAAALIGINGLEPEESTNFSAGFVARPVDGLTITLDAYQIQVDNRIVNSGQLFGSGGATTPIDVNSPAVRAAIIANGNTLDSTVSQTGVIIFNNGLDTRTNGVDLLATYSTDLGAFGSIDWSLNGNYTETKVTHIAAPPPQLNPGVTFLDAAALSNIETAAPKYRAALGALWKVGNLSINLKEALYGDASVLQTRTGGIYYRTELAPALITDLDISYEVVDGVKVSVGANNLFNKYPDHINGLLRQDYLQVNSQGYTQQYATFSPFGINGGYYYGRLAYSF
ncbi:MAG TPA: TonB-dependent receptor [Hyphomonadaceae bacterium]|jgi:iron complex outermembrane receptor protein|nr:TonB-dependent receptor [Hyphomonadaceae bacterium]